MYGETRTGQESVADHVGLEMIRDLGANSPKVVIGSMEGVRSINKNVLVLLLEGNLLNIETNHKRFL